MFNEAQLIFSLPVPSFLVLAATKVPPADQTPRGHRASDIAIYYQLGATFWEAVQVEMIRLAYQGQGTGGAARP
jgi:hypothetical protein